MIDMLLRSSHVEEFRDLAAGERFLESRSKSRDDDDDDDGQGRFSRVANRHSINRVFWLSTELAAIKFYTWRWNSGREGRVVCI